MYRLILLKSQEKQYKKYNAFFLIKNRCITNQSHLIRPLIYKTFLNIHF